MNPSVTTRAYSGSSLISSNEVVNFGIVPPLTKSEIIVVTSEFNNVNAVGEIGIGVASSNIPGGPSGVLLFDVFDSLDQVVEPTRTFAGESGDEGISNVEDVGKRSSLASKYVALMIQAKDKPIDCGCIIMKWFFGFDVEE